MRKEEITEVIDNGHKFWCEEEGKLISVSASKIDTTKMAHSCAQLMRDKWPAREGPKPREANV